MGNCFLEEVREEEMESVLEMIKRNAQTISSEDKVEIMMPASSYPTVKRKENTLFNNGKYEKNRFVETDGKKHFFLWMRVFHRSWELPMQKLMLQEVSVIPKV